MNDDDYEEVGIFESAKRLGVQRAPWMGDWFVSWSPRNDNSNAEGTWAHWANLAAFILKHPATEAIAPHLYRADLPVVENIYVGGGSLTEEQIAKFFPQESRHAE